VVWRVCKWSGGYASGLEGMSVSGGYVSGLQSI
jgi:hypothetical protein